MERHRLRFRALLFAALLAGVFTIARPAPGQLPLTAPGAPESPAPTAPANATTAAPTTAASDEFEAKRQDVARRLSIARQALESAQAAGDDTGAAVSEKLTREADLLRQLELNLGQQKAAAEQLAEREAKHLEWTTRLEAQQSGAASSDPTPTFLQWDRMRDELASETNRTESIAAAVLAADEALKRARDAEAEKDRARRQAKEALDASKETPAPPRLAEAHRLAELESQLATEIARLRDQELAIERQKQVNHGLRVTLLQSQVERLADQVRFTKKDLDDRLVEIAREEEELQREARAVGSELANLERESGGLPNLSPGNHPSLADEGETHRLRREVQQQQSYILDQRLARLAKVRTAWTRRFHVANGTITAGELDKWHQETAETLDQVGRDALLQTMRGDELRNDLAALDARSQTASDDEAKKNQIEQQRQRMLDLGRVYDTNLVSIESSRRLHEKLLAEIRNDVESMTLGERAALWWQRLKSVWSYELTSVDDRPITVGKVISGLILLVIGYLVSRFLSRLFGRRVLPRVGMHQSAAAALQTVVFYTLVATFAMLALWLVNVPLAVFTFLGGAVAIGVGFGSQKIINNFISGLILLAERPIRVGDLIQIDGLYGTVSQIGARSTRVTTANNVEIIVPNSSFLENNVVNWTLSDDRVRTMVAVGVAYGSPTRDVSRLLKRAADEHGLVMASPEPFVWFTEFGDNALQFQLHFWLQMKNLSDRLRVESDMRHKIDSLFREARIEIAFPQRDVHLDTLRPLDVRLLPQAVEAEESKAA
jgi:small-conductance mechanosensitive channel